MERGAYEGHTMKLTALALILAASLLPAPAAAEGNPYWVDRAFGTHRQYRDYSNWRPRYRPPVYGWRQRHQPYVPHEHDKSCKPLIRVVGDQRPTEEGAKEQADKAWMQEVRFRYGERYMLTTQAKDRRYACSRSSIGELVGQTMLRCEVIAQPCPAEVIWTSK